MNEGIIIAGNMVVDVIKTIESYPAELSLTTVKNIEHSIGGAVCNCGIDLAKMDPELPVTVLGAVGDDDFGKTIIDRLASYGNINTGHILAKGRTSFTDVMTEEKSGSRTFFTFKGADSSYSVEDVPFDRLRGTLLHIGYIMLLDKLDSEDPEYGTAMAKLLCLAQKRGLKTSIDVVTETGDRYKTLVPPSLRYTDYCCINETEAQMITDVPLLNLEGEERRRNFQEACAILKEMGVSSWAVIHSPPYCAGLDEENTFCELESLLLPGGFIQGSVGAGDAFVSGILYFIHNGRNLAGAMKLGEAVAISSLSRKGATEGVGPLDEILEKYRILIEKQPSLKGIRPDR